MPRNTAALAYILVVLCFAAGTAGAVNIETVTVGNPGNTADTRYASPGYGAVDYTYNIGKYEVTAAQYTEFLNAVAGVDAYGLYNADMWTETIYGCKIERYAGSGTADDPYQYRVASDWANRPVNYVCWGDAARFCNWLENGQPSGLQGLTTTEDGAYYLNGATTYAELIAVTREPGATWVIPSEDEWYKAAYHKNDGVTGNYFDYATSSDSVPSNDLVNPDPGNNATYKIGSDYTIGSPYYRTEVGAHENSESPYGTFDQSGNVYEWNEALVYGSCPGLRGGAFCSYVGPLGAGDRLAYIPTVEFSYFGFRVSAVPEPGMMALLALGVAAMLVSHRARE